jgi:hypothetical protein
LRNFLSLRAEVAQLGDFAAGRAAFGLSHPLQHMLTMGDKKPAPKKAAKGGKPGK